MQKKNCPEFRTWSISAFVADLLLLLIQPHSFSPRQLNGPENTLWTDIHRLFIHLSSLVWLDKWLILYLAWTTACWMTNRLREVQLSIQKKLVYIFYLWSTTWNKTYTQWMQWCLKCLRHWVVDWWIGVQASRPKSWHCWGFEQGSLSSRGAVSSLTLHSDTQPPQLGYVKK